MNQSNRNSQILPNNQQTKYKMCLIGDCNVGKTSLILTYTKEKSKRANAITLGANYLTKTIETRGRTIDVNIWDTAGSERFRSMTSMYFRGACAFLIVYDVTDRESFDGISGWLVQIKKEIDTTNVTICVVGNKCDLKEQRVVSTEEGEETATMLGCLFEECSSLDTQMVEKVFMKVFNEMVLFDENEVEDDGEKINLVDVGPVEEKKCC